MIKKGKGVKVYENVVFDVDKKAKLIFGKRCTIHDFCHFRVMKYMKIGDFCSIGAGCKFIDHNHNIARDKKIKGQGRKASKIIIGDDCWFGYNCSIIPGAKLGKGCVIGAGSVVNKEFSPYSIIAGVPARKIGERK